jgi:phosphatidate phosphatase APP1
VVELGTKILSHSPEGWKPLLSFMTIHAFPALLHIYTQYAGSSYTVRRPD